MSNESPLSKKSVGLGDTVAKVAYIASLGTIKPKAPEAGKKDCGCKKRQEALNKKFSYNKKGK